MRVLTWFFLTATCYYLLRGSRNASKVSAASIYDSKNPNRTPPPPHGSGN